MRERDTIASFLQTTHRLRKAAPSGDLAAVCFETDTWIGQYKRIIEQLEGDHQQNDTGREFQPCWKISQDLLIRLQKLSVDTEDKQQSRVLFTDQDRDVLQRRLLDIQQRLNITKEEMEITEQGTPTLADSFLGLNVGDSISMADSDKAQGCHETVRVAVDRSAVSGTKKTARGFNKAILQDFILESLRFKSMGYREQDIEQAHNTSFDWIFNNQASDSHPSFPEWLSTTKLGNIYWVTGKPGSGKSTLIRYLSGHRKTTRLLHAWAGNPNVTVAGFYFWTSGSPEQRSQTGLLRSLLFQLLSTKPDLIADVLPHLWNKLASMTSKERVATTVEWSTSELMNGFSTFLGRGLSETKLCLFIDGLDEFDGDHEAIIHFFRDLAEGDQGPRIKLCLSSRPWPVFERAFEYAVPNLRLEASNFQDMMHYTIDKLSGHENLRSAMLQEMDLARKLVQTTVERANGVFLWVRLAVGELIRRSEHAVARVEEMLGYVLALPTGLDNLFEALVFQNQSQDKQVETSRLFQLVRAREMVAEFIQDDSATSLSLWELAFAINGDSDDDASLECDVQQEPQEIATQRCDATRSWALSCSVGLLEVHHRSGSGSSLRQSNLEPLAQQRVTYLHRTIRDWIVLSPGDQVWRRLESAGKVLEADVFDPHLRLLRSYVLRMKHPLEEPEHHRRLDEWYPDIALALTHARYVEHDPKRLQVRLIGEVDKTISWYWVSRGPKSTDHWARNSFGTYEERLGNKLIIAHPYLALCTRFGLQHYVIDALNQLATEPPENGDGHDEATGHANQIAEETPLLYRALEFLCSRQKTIYPLSSLSFVRQLLEVSDKHASHPTLPALVSGPNTPPWTSPLLQKKQVTTWIMVIRQLRDAKRRGWIEQFDIDPAGTERWTAIIECLVRHGADRQAVVQRDGWDPETSVKGVIGRGGLLDDLADYWVEERLTPLFGDFVRVAATPEATERPQDKQSRLEHIFTSPVC
ncbi:small s protein [Cordyceps javanica]|uniref:Small s protein n=1 Tax=Cordyceps javanica TaxID=43265 RepID=A0A545VCZ6_9HYPO|nr:small s protein [Cordyceps javanica]TQW10833.1 NACHT domain-containing protein [Cordyceps javanica]